VRLEIAPIRIALGLSQNSVYDATASRRPAVRIQTPTNRRSLRRPKRSKMKRATFSWTSAEAPFVPAVWHDIEVAAVSRGIAGDVAEPSGVFARVDLLENEVGLWCSLPAALSTHAIERRPPRLHLHVRPKSGGRKTLDTDIDSLLIGAGGVSDLDPQVEGVTITPAIALKFARTLRSNHPCEVSACSRCGYAAIALGSCRDPHRCANCGSERMLASMMPATPRTGSAQAFCTPSRVLDLDRLDGCTYMIWASTPAVIWTAQRPQEVGIHVHADREGDRIVDETFASVRLHGKELDRSALLESMIENADVQA
jgi:hypothetical protein